jgi:Major Facilitator Superfamily
VSTPPAGAVVPPDVDVDRARVQRRTVGVLAAGVALGGLGVTVGITVGGLIARDVAGTDTAAGLGSTAGVLGAAVLAVPLAGMSDRAGRRVGLAVGYAIAVAGAVVAVLATFLSSLFLLLIGLFLFGASTACGLQARYAAADLAEPEHRGRALSLVVWATTVGSVLGPNVAGPGDSGCRRWPVPSRCRRSPSPWSVPASSCSSGPTHCCSRGVWAVAPTGHGLDARPQRRCARCGPRRAAGSASPRSWCRTP